jgi:hypothetical protein
MDTIVFQLRTLARDPKGRPGARLDLPNNESFVVQSFPHSDWIEGHGGIPALRGLQPDPVAEQALCLLAEKIRALRVGQRVDILDVVVLKQRERTYITAHVRASPVTRVRVAANLVAAWKRQVTDKLNMRIDQMQRTLAAQITQFLANRLNEPKFIDALVERLQERKEARLRAVK